MPRRDAKAKVAREVFDARAIGCKCDECPLVKTGKPVAPPGLKRYPGRGRLLVVLDEPSVYEEEKGKILDTAANRLLDETLHYVNAGTVHETYTTLCNTKGLTDTDLQRSLLACKPRLSTEFDAFQHSPGSNSSDPQWALFLGNNTWRSLASDTFRGDCTSWYGSPLVLKNSEGNQQTNVIATKSFSELVTKGGRRHTGRVTKHVERAAMLADGRLDKFEWPKETVDVGECVPALGRLLHAVRRGAQYGFDLESDGLEYSSNISCMAFALPEESVCIQFPPTSDEKVLMEELLRLPGMVGQNVGYFDRPLLQHQGWRLHDDFFDTVFAASVLDPQQDKDLHSLVAGEFAAEAWKAGFKTDVDTGVLQGGIWGSTDMKVARERRVYCGRDAYTTLRVAETQQIRLRSYGQQFLDDLMFQYPISMQMRRTGILWNRDAAARLDAEWSLAQAWALQKARILAAKVGPEFADLNPGSPTQLRELFFVKCGLAPTHWTNKGAVSTGYDAMMAIRKQGDNRFAAELAGQILWYRDADKMLGTYVRGMAPPPGQDRCFGDWKVHATVSGRWGCSGVPLQTLSATTRELFIAAPGNVFIEVDLASAEGRTIALLSGSEKLLGIFERGEDLYSNVGSEMFGTPVKKEDKLRQLAKTSFLSLNYGAQPDTAYNMFWADEDIRKHFPNLTVRDVEAIRNKYMKVLPEIFVWGKAEQKASQTRGYYLCPWNGRQLPFYGPAELSFAANFPNQAGVAWWICNTLRRVMPLLPAFRAELRTQVHDSLTVECPKNVSQDVAAMLVSAMGGTLSLHGRSVQMKAEYKIGRTLQDVK